MTERRHMGMSYGRKVVREADGSLVAISWIIGPPMSADRVPSKAKGRKGTRRAWKRKHPPGWFYRLFLGK